MAVRSLALLCLSATVLAAGCSGDDNPGATKDLALAEAGRDLGPLDQLSSDHTTDAAPADGTSADSSVPLAGFGSLSGACGVLDEEEWSSASPFFFRNAIDFGSATFEAAALSAGGQQILAEGNLNDGSLNSEVIAFEVEHRCELAGLLKTEGTVTYADPDGKRTDLLLAIDGRQIGLSVTRAYHYPPSTPYTVEEAHTLLEKKLGDLPLSQANAEPPDEWSRSMLQVIAYDGQYADAVEQAWNEMDAAVKGDAILILTTTDGEDGFIY